MSSEFRPTYVHYSPDNGRPGRGYLLRTTAPDAGEFGGYEYFRIWVTVPKDRPDLIPTGSDFKKYRKVNWDTDMDPGALSASLMTSHDVYEMTTDDPPTLRQDNTTYHPYGWGSDKACCIINSVVVCYNGMRPGEVVETLAAYAKKKEIANAAIALKELRPYVLKTGSLNAKAYLIRDVAPGSEDKLLSCFLTGDSEPFTYVGDFGPFKFRNKQLAKTEGLHVGDIVDELFYERALVVFGVLSTREDGKWRRAAYAFAADTLSSVEERKKMSNEVEPLEHPEPPSDAAPVTSPSIETPNEAEVGNAELPASEKRTRAQLYAALVAAEKFGDRTIRASRFEGNARQIGTDTYSHETIVREAPNMAQGELVSLVTVLVNRIMADDVIIDAYNKAKSEGRVLDAPQRAPSIRIETNLIISGVGYDPQ